MSKDGNLTTIRLEKESFFSGRLDDVKHVVWSAVNVLNTSVCEIKQIRDRIKNIHNKVVNIDSRLKRIEEELQDYELVRNAPDQFEAILKRNKCSSKPTVWFVDSENVGHLWMNAVGREAFRGDVIRYMFTANSPAISNKTRELCRNYCITLIPEPCTCEQKNALDFQIVSALSMEAVKRGKSWRYRVVSSDRGFTSAVEYLNKRGFDAAIVMPVVK